MAELAPAALSGWPAYSPAALTVHASRAYDRQNRRGQNYDVPPVYLIDLMDIEVGHPDVEFWKDKYVSEYTFREKESHDLLAETIVIIFAEMAHFERGSKSV